MQSNHCSATKSNTVEGIMAKQRKPRFSVTATNVGPNTVHEEIRKAQMYLARFGYLGADKAIDGRLDKDTATGFEKLQETFRLPVTGLLDDATAALINMPRCGVPDYFPFSGRGMPTIPARFGVSGCTYHAQVRTLTYAFTAFSSDLQSADQIREVESAFTTWQNEIPMDFQMVAPNLSPRLRIGWFQGTHGDGSDFDGVGNVLAHAFYPPPCGGCHAGDFHFDDGETWAIAAGAGVFDIQTVALHEIGHLLGLTHTNVAGAVMFPTYQGQLRTLQADDIAGIRTIYGRRGPVLQVLVHLEGIGDVRGRDSEFLGTRGQSRRLEGFEIRINPAIPGLSLQYMAHLQGIGDVPFVNEGQFVGTRGQSRRLEGFAIQLTGAAANNYNVVYMAHLQGSADTGLFRNGQFCGTRGESRRVEGILVRIEPR
jgi:hypothetical protein